MKVMYSFPPNIEAINKVFPADLTARALFAYGDIIYHPSGGPIPEALVLHENVHRVQQRQVGSPEEWWEWYLTIPEFRLAEEFEAHYIELEHRKAKATNRRARRALLKPMAERLASSLYGNMITTRQAAAALKRGHLYEREGTDRDTPTG